MKHLIKTLTLLLLITANVQNSLANDVWDGKTIATGFYSGTGTMSNPYTIYTASQFAYFFTQMANEERTFDGQYIKLMNDIDMGDGDIQLLKENSIAVNVFKGHFDGGDHTVLLVCGYFNGYGSMQYHYLFGELYGSLHNIAIQGHGYYSGYGGPATFVASIMEGGEVYNCHFKSPVMGGITLHGGKIANCITEQITWRTSWKYGASHGFCSVEDYTTKPYGFCLSCDFDNCVFYNAGSGKAFNYGSDYYGTYYPPYYNTDGTIHRKGVENECNGTLTPEEYNEWVAANSTSYRTYKTWPLTFTPEFPDYNVTITFVDNSKFTKYAPQTIIAGTAYHLPVPTGFESEFLGWEVNGEIVSSVSPTDNVVCTAKWKHNFTKQPTAFDTEVLTTEMSRAKCQWRVGAAKSIHFDDPQNVTKINVLADNMVLFFDYIVDSYEIDGSYDTHYYPGYVRIDGEDVIYVGIHGAKKRGLHDMFLRKQENIQ